MRLLHTTTITLCSFDDDDSVPPYAILSHTWGDAEILFHDLIKNAASELSESDGYEKIRSCCALAAAGGYEYVWIDTCCIDKTSSAELSEAINSMYRWYHEAQVCYAYLSDFCIDYRALWRPDVEVEFGKSRWFTRGWTLQELLAPEIIEFHDKDWRYFGSKSTLKAQISLVTGIQQGHMTDMSRASVAQKMSWASERKTRRVEDMAYSLMGIFDVNMPLIYGEGKKAFMRLQQEIVRITDDESIFAWTDGDLIESGIFAQSPEAFAESRDVVQITDDDPLYVHRAPYTLTNRGLAIEIFANKGDDKGGRTFVPLNCERYSGSAFPQLAIELEYISRNNYTRTSPEQLFPAMKPNFIPVMRPNQMDIASLVYVRPVYMRKPPGEWKPVDIYLSSPVIRGLTILDTFDCLPEYYYRGLNETPVRIRLSKDLSIAALLLKGDGQLFGILFHAVGYVLSISLTLFSSAQDFLQEMDKHKYGPKYPLPSHVRLADPVTQQLQDGCWVSMNLAGGGRERTPGRSREREYRVKLVAPERQHRA